MNGLEHRLEIGKLFNDELERLGSGELPKNGSRSAQEELKRTIILAKIQDHAPADGDITELGDTKKRVFRGLVERVRFWGGKIIPETSEPVVLNNVYLNAYPMEKKVIEQIEHLVFFGNGVSSSNGHKDASGG